MLTAELDYELPPERIAQQPLAERDSSRLLVVRRDGALQDHVFRDLPVLLRPGDLLVANDTRVRQARLETRDEAGRAVELLVLRRCDAGAHLCLAQPAKRAAPGTSLRVNEHLAAVVLSRSDEHPGGRVVRFECDGDVDSAIERWGTAPLPPYIHQPARDPRRYQTVYAAGAPESAAAPTAGLHFTPGLIAALRSRGIGWATVQLEIGLATFVPIRTETVDEHPMHEERCHISPETAECITTTRSKGGRVVAVGTTVVRTLETFADEDGTVCPGMSSTSLFIAPGHRFRAVDMLLTNFHQPRSSLLALLAAFIGTNRWRQAYQHALDADYRFLSFGDCMLCEPALG